MHTVKYGRTSFPDYQIDIKRHDKRVVIVIDGEKIVDSSQALLLCEQDHDQVYYFPHWDVTMQFMEKITKKISCLYKGEASHWSLNIKNTKITIAAWSYENPMEQVSRIKNYIAFYPEVMKYAVYN